MQAKNFKRGVSTVTLLAQARVFAKETGLKEFIGSSNYVYKFMKRNELAMQSRTSVGQTLLANWTDVRDVFNGFVKNQIKKNSFSAEDIYNMDEVPMTFKLPTL